MEELKKTVDMDEYRPHVVSEVICVKCCHRWISVRPAITLLKDLECPNCGKGAVIETGQILDPDEKNKKYRCLVLCAEIAKAKRQCLKSRSIRDADIF